MKNQVANNKGFSLIGTLVSISITALLMQMMVSLSVFNTRTANTARVDSDILGNVQQLRSELEAAGTIDTTLRTKGSGWSIKNIIATEKMVSGQKIVAYRAVYQRNVMNIIGPEIVSRDIGSVKVVVAPPIDKEDDDKDGHDDDDKDEHDDHKNDRDDDRNREHGEKKEDCKKN
jgi:type II secretory pathway pseudopilin PulG